MPQPQIYPTSKESGDMNEKSPGAFFSGLRKRMLMPRFMNGLLKSMTRSRIEVIVIGAIAMSADFAPQTRAQQPLLQIRRD